MRKHFGIGRSIKHKTLRRVVRVSVGIALIAVGVLGLVLPFLPGWPFLATGFILLWPKSRLARWLVRVLGRIREWRRRRASAVGGCRRRNDVGIPAAVGRPQVSESELKG